MSLRTPKQLIKRSLSKLHLSAEPVQSPTTPPVRAFRCDIHAGPDAEYAEAELACKLSVLEAEGQIIDDIAYPGGFLYTLPPLIRNPLQTGDNIDDGVDITVSVWHPFPAPEWDGLHMTPYGGMGDLSPGKSVRGHPIRDRPVSESTLGRPAVRDTDIQTLLRDIQVTDKRTKDWILGLASQRASLDSPFTSRAEERPTSMVSRFTETGLEEEGAMSALSEVETARSFCDNQTTCAR